MKVDHERETIFRKQHFEFVSCNSRVCVRREVGWLKLQREFHKINFLCVGPTKNKLRTNIVFLHWSKTTRLFLNRHVVKMDPPKCLKNTNL